MACDCLDAKEGNANKWLLGTGFRFAPASPRARRCVREMNSEQDQEQTKKAGWLVFSLILWAAVFVLVLFSLPKFERMFEEMLPGETLPFLTQLVCCIPLGGYAAMMVAGIVSLLWMQYSISSATFCRRINIVAGLLSILFFIVYVTGLFLPLTTLIEGIGR